VRTDEILYTDQAKIGDRSIVPSFHRSVTVTAAQHRAQHSIAQNSTALMCSAVVVLLFDSNTRGFVIQNIPPIEIPSLVTHHLQLDWV
jgi:hypothetical protein